MDQAKPTKKIEKLVNLPKNRKNLQSNSSTIKATIKNDTKTTSNTTTSTVNKVTPKINIKTTSTNSSHQNIYFYNSEHLFRPKTNRRLEKEKALMMECLEKYRRGEFDSPQSLENTDSDDNEANGDEGVYKDDKFDSLAFKRVKTNDGEPIQGRSDDDNTNSMSYKHSKYFTPKVCDSYSYPNSTSVSDNISSLKTSKINLKKSSKYFSRESDNKNSIDLGYYSLGQNGVSSKPIKSKLGQNAKADMQDLDKSFRKFTPLELQFLNMKNEWPDAILMIECGYRYRFFGDDAQMASKLLNIQCNPDKNFVTSSVPAHRLSAHLKRLVQAGLKVAVINQNGHSKLLDCPDNFYDRNLSHLYTKSTFLITPHYEEYALFDKVVDNSMSIKQDLEYTNPLEEELDMQDSQDIPGALVIMYQDNGGKSKKALSTWDSTMTLPILAVKFGTGEISYNEISGEQHSTTLKMISQLERLMTSLKPTEILLPDGANLCEEVEKVVKDVVRQSVKTGDLIRVERLSPSQFEKDDVLEYLTVSLLSCNKSENIGLLTKNDRLLRRATLHSVLVRYLKTGFFSERAINALLPLDQMILSMRDEPNSKMATDGNLLEHSASLYSHLFTGKDGRASPKTPQGRRKLLKWIEEPLTNLNNIEGRLDTVGELLGLVNDSSQDSLLTLSLLNSILSSNNSGTDLQKVISLVKYELCKPSHMANIFAFCTKLDRVFKKYRPNDVGEDSKLRYIFKSRELEENLRDISKITARVNDELQKDFLRTGLVNIEALRQNNIENIFNNPNEENYSFNSSSLVDFSSASTLNALVQSVPELTRLRYAKLDIMDSLETHLHNLTAVTNPQIEIVRNFSVYHEGYKRIGENFKAKKTGMGTCLRVSNDDVIAGTVKIPLEWIRINSTKKWSRYKDPFIIDIDARFNQWTASFSLQFNRIWKDFQRYFDATYFNDIKTILDKIGDLDCWMCLALLSSQPGYTRPFFIQHGKLLHIEGGRHPFDISGTRHKDFISNDTFLDLENRRCMILTGPNQSGKSTYLHQVCMLAILAQIGCYVPADKYITGIFDRIFIKTGTHEDLMNGQSMGLSEWNDMGLILNQTTNNSLVLIDELGLSTSICEAEALSYSSLYYLVDEIKCLTICATHLPLVTTLQEKFPENVVNCHMSTILEEIIVQSTPSQTTTETNQDLTYLYKCVEGRTLNSHGINSARCAGLPRDIVDKANSIARKYEAVYHNDKKTLDNFLDYFTETPRTIL
ncbi:DNA mismatch repair protein Msh3-like isoform X1 [Gordionus sp. m RMFG-2023]|uniref:DNA mismatch repair protein Msh3-like isoform X1 n=1 Tax=Gordionus sp. m RMFG-2023 TaxID=3053472 RepID=UPI0031FC2EF3